MHDADEALALQALGWILTDEPRAERLLALTGLTPQDLRESLGDRSTLAAILSFLTAHESDLVGCAVGLDRKPEDLAAAGHRLSGDERTEI